MTTNGICLVPSPLQHTGNETSNLSFLKTYSADNIQLGECLKKSSNLSALKTFTNTKVEAKQSKRNFVSQTVLSLKLNAFVVNTD